MVVAPTGPGNHMRLHRGGGRSNQREVDVIINEVIRTYCPDVAGTDIGITTPYRRQVDRVADSLIDQIERTRCTSSRAGSGGGHPHHGLGRDLAWRTGLKFADDPHLINVAVSRAVRRFILVTNNDMLPTSRHIRTWSTTSVIRTPARRWWRAPWSRFSTCSTATTPPSAVAGRELKNEMAYKSEDIVWTVLHDILAEKRYAHLVAVYQVLLRNLLFGVDELTTRQEAYVRHRASVDFVVYNRVSNRPVLAIEVDGFAYHEDNPAQLARMPSRTRSSRRVGCCCCGCRLRAAVRTADPKALDDVEDSVIAGSRT